LIVVAHKHHPWSGAKDMTDLTETKPAGSNSVTQKPEAPTVGRMPLSEFSHNALGSKPANASSTRASVVGPEFESKAGDQKLSGAESLNGFANALRNAANELDGDIPLVPTYIRKAAFQLDNVADAVRVGDFSELIESGRSYVKRKPAVVIGAAVVVGFGMVRLLTASREMPENRVQNSANHHKIAN
jgi:hypothetical protein